MREIVIRCYPDHDTQWLADKIGCTVKSLYSQANILGVKKSEEYHNKLMQNEADRLRKVGKKTRFKKGHTPDNKGLKQSEWMSKESIKKSAKTRFKKGDDPHNTKYDGHISIRNTKGRPYKWIRLKKGKYVLLHRHIWIKKNGPIKPNEVITFKDGNSMNCNIDNLEKITRVKNMKNNTIHNYPEELKSTIRLISKLSKSINHAEKQNV